MRKVVLTQIFYTICQILNRSFTSIREDNKIDGVKYKKTYVLWYLLVEPRHWQDLFFPELS